MGWIVLYLDLSGSHIGYKTAKTHQTISLITMNFTAIYDISKREKKMRNV